MRARSAIYHTRAPPTAAAEPMLGVDLKGAQAAAAQRAAAGQYLYLKIRARTGHRLRFEQQNKRDEMHTRDRADSDHGPRHSRHRTARNPPSQRRGTRRDTRRGETHHSRVRGNGRGGDRNGGGALTAEEIAALQSREITPEDYALLLRLEADNVVERHPPAPREAVRKLPRLVCAEASASAEANWICESEQWNSNARACARRGQDCGCAGPADTGCEAWGAVRPEGGSGSSQNDRPVLRLHKGEVCSICIDAMKPGDILLRLPRCGHHFHASCVTEWLLAHRNACPLCMKPAV